MSFHFGECACKKRSSWEIRVHTRGCGRGGSSTDGRLQGPRSNSKHGRRRGWALAVAAYSGDAGRRATAAVSPLGLDGLYPALLPFARCAVLFREEVLLRQWSKLENISYDVFGLRRPS